MTFEKPSPQIYKNTGSVCFVLGGSRGLGKALGARIPGAINFSRKAGVQVDLSKSGSVELILGQVAQQKPSRIFYCAGGGPHGDFFSKSLSSHQWAFQVNTFTPLSLAQGLKEQGYLGEFVYIGSAIAERSRSLKSLSYSMAKKMSLKALLSLSEEDLKVRVFSPPYMDTGLLPQKSWPRLESPSLVLDPNSVAQELLTWLESKKEWNLNERHFDWLREFDYPIPSDKDI